MGRDDPPEELEDGVDWGPFDEELTRVDEIEPIPEEAIETGPHDVTKLPGYDLGVVAGRARRTEEMLVAFRLNFIAGGTDPGSAYAAMERLRRWIEIPENQELVDEVLKPARA